MAHTDSSATRSARTQRYVVGKAADIADGERLIVNVAGRSVGVFNVGGTFYAFLNRCPHRGAELCRGDVLGQLKSDRPGDLQLDNSRKFLVCPWHGWEFDIETGASWFDPERTKARPFHIDVERGDVVADELAEGQAVEPGTDVSHFIDPVTHRIKGPYQADALPVAVEDEYIVLSLRRQGPKPATSTVAKEG